MDITFHDEQLQKLEQINNDKHHALRIAVCGKFKSGKTSLLNLLLGTTLPVQSVTATGIVTKIIYGDYSSVKYIDGSVSQVSSEELSKLITVASKTLDSITLGNARVAYIGSRSELLKRGKVEFWDTPGLEDDPKLTAITMDAIHQCDLVICVMHANQVLSLYEKRLFQKLFKLMNGNIIFVVNHIDSLYADEREQVISTVKKTLKQYPNKYCSDGNLFFTSANPEHPYIYSLKYAVSQIIQNKLTRREIQTETKIGKSRVLTEEWNYRLQEDKEMTEQNLIKVQSQIDEDIENKKKVINEQYKYGVRDIQQAQEIMQSKLLSELTWRRALLDYQDETDWEKNFRDGAAEWLKEYILQIINDANASIAKALRNCSFFREKFAIVVDEKIWKKQYVYPKNFVRPLFFPERRFQQFCSDCIDRTIPLLMSCVIDELSERANDDIDSLLEELESSCIVGCSNITAEQKLLNFHEKYQTEYYQLNEYITQSEDLCRDISYDIKRRSHIYKFIDFFSTLFPRILYGEIFG